MSFQVFKTNMSLWMQTPDKLSTGNAESYEDFADYLTTQYDLAVRTGNQTANLVPVSKGNKDLMKSLIQIACLKALQVREGKHTFIDDIGKAVVGYWTGCQLQAGVPPVIPAFGAIYNISTVYAFCTSPGTWTPFGPTNPIDDSDIFLDILISSMRIHLTTLQFLYFTTSIYPGPALPPAPGILTGTGYFIPPSTPSPPPNLIQVVEEIIANQVDDNSDNLTEQEKEQIKEEKTLADNIVSDTTQTPQGKQVAQEFSSRASQMLSSGKHDSTPVYFSDEELKAIDELQEDDFKCEAGARIVEAARKDIGICEFNNKNYGGFGPGEQRNESGRIDEMVASTGLDNEGQVRKTGSGFFWCAAATTQWWKEAGIELPPTLRALCNGWLAWSKEKGYFSNIPKQGAAILYRGSRKPGAVHIGIVESIVPGVGVNTIEGNTGGGAAFADNGGGCYRKLAKWSKGNIIGFVNPPDCL
tara:strand:- start:6481 stop:7893 length:1413 start_codon:yes stop_codon:yes gene_type:complete